MNKQKDRSKIDLKRFYLFVFKIKIKWNVNFFKYKEIKRENKIALKNRFIAYERLLFSLPIPNTQ